LWLLSSVLSKKIVPILLLLILGIPIAGTYFYFKQRQYEIRKSIKRQIKKGASEQDLILLKIPKKLEDEPNADFERIHSKEFRYKGEMYDIVRSKNYETETWYWCIWDKEETELFASLNILFQRAWNSDPAQKQAQTHLSNFFNSLFLPCKPPDKKPGTIINFFYITRNIIIHDLFSEKQPSPPPKNIVLT